MLGWSKISIAWLKHSFVWRRILYILLYCSMHFAQFTRIFLYFAQFTWIFLHSFFSLLTKLILLQILILKLIPTDWSLVTWSRLWQTKKSKINLDFFDINQIANKILRFIRPFLFIRPFYYKLKLKASSSATVIVMIDFMH